MRCWSSGRLGGEQLAVPDRARLQRQVRPARRPYETVEPVVLDRCQIARFDPRAWALHHDLEVLRRLEADAGNGLDPAWAGELLRELNRFCNVWDEDDRPPGTTRRRCWRRCCCAATARPPMSCRRSAMPTSTPPGCGRWRRPPQARAHASSQTAYMDRYPEYRFCCSQAQQYDWIRERNPDLYDRVRERVGRRAVGAGGRHLGRAGLQPAVGRVARPPVPVRAAVLRARFGRRCREFWSPDVFGYTGQLPQIMAAPASTGS